MRKIMKHIAVLTVALLPTLSFAASNDGPVGYNLVPLVSHDISAKAEANKNWKLAYATGTNSQVVFMSVCPKTNPANEVGLEVHPFDQIIYIVDGNAKAILNGKVIMAKAGDMIFVPQNTPHNVINLNQHKPLKLISVYSHNDIPANSVYRTKADTL